MQVFAHWLNIILLLTQHFFATDEFPLVCCRRFLLPATNPIDKERAWINNRKTPAEATGWVAIPVLCDGHF